MKWGISFPEEEILIVRPSLKAICAGNGPAAKLLSVLLYRYSIRKESREDAENMNEVAISKGKAPTQDTSFRIYRKQKQLVKDMCDEVVEKTLHDVAVPTLQLLGYLDIDESNPIICYDLHPDVVHQAMEAYKKGPIQLEKFLIGSIQLEKFLITDQLEKFPIDKKFFQFLLEKVLIANRKSSNCKRGRKPASEKGASTQNEKPQNKRENKSKNNIENKVITDTAEAGVSTLTLSLEEKALILSFRENNTNPKEITANDTVSRFLTNQTELSTNTVDNHKEDVPETQNKAHDADEKASVEIETTNAPTPSTQGILASSQSVSETEKPKRNRKPASPVTPPVMPDEKAIWSPETILEIFEARIGRRYPNGAKRASSRVRDVELDSCTGIYQMTDLWSGDVIANVTELNTIIDHMETRNNNWWLNTNGHVLPHQLVDKDRIHTMVEELKRKNKASNQHRTTASVPLTGMGHDEAMELATDVLQQTRELGYSKIQATPHARDGVWMVRVIWEDGEALPDMKSRKDWDVALKYNLEFDQEDATKGIK